jgi:proteasome lid subunit RPN8/RPN11
MKKQNDIQLLLDPKILLDLIKCVENAFPSEACGLIFGNILEIPNEQQEDDYYYQYVCRNFHCISSDESSSVSFLIANEELLHDIIFNETQASANNNEIRLISVFHSHPKGTSPSLTDMDQMKYLDYFSSINHNYGNKAFKHLIWVIMDAVNHNLDGYIYFEREIQQVKILSRKI